MGNNNKAHIVYLIDFGLAKRYKDSKNVHIPYKDDKHLAGTPRYASINAHLGIGTYFLKFANGCFRAK